MCHMHREFMLEDAVRTLDRSGYLIQQTSSRLANGANMSTIKYLLRRTL